MIHTSPGSLKSSKSDQSLDSYLRSHLPSYFSLLFIGKFYFNLFAKYKLHIHRFNTAAKGQNSRNGVHDLFITHGRKKKSGFPEISWQLSKDRNDKHTPCIYVYVVRQSSQMVWVENNWHRAVKRHREAEVQAYQPLSTCRGEAREDERITADRTRAEAKGHCWLRTPYRQGVQGGVRLFRGACQLHANYSRIPATKEGEKSGLEQPKPCGNLWRVLIIIAFTTFFFLS